MNITVPFKTFGDRENKDAILVVPDDDKVKSIFDRYTFEIVQYPNQGITTVFVTCSGEDVISKTHNNINPIGMSNTIRSIVEYLSA